MRLVPTLFLCNQLIKHQGILVNKIQITSLNFYITIGDIVEIADTQ